MRELEVLAIVMGDAKGFQPCLEGGGGAKSFGPVIFPFCSPPPLPVISDQSLTYMPDR